MRQNETRVWDVVARDPRSESRPGATPASEPADNSMFSAAEVLGLARRHRLLIGATTFASAVAVTLIAVAMPKYFEATTRMLIDPRGLDVVDKRVTPGPATVEQGAALVESEVHVLSSDSVLSRVIGKHHLAADPEFYGTDAGPLALITGSLAAVRASLDAALGLRRPEPAPELITLQTLREAIYARREPTSYTVEVGVTTKDPQKSAAIANWITQEYLATRIDTRATITARAGHSLTGRLDELRKELEEAERKVESYKREHDIFTASGQLVSEQQLAGLNSQLVDARTETLRASARLEQIRVLASAGLGPDATLEALQSENVGRLRQQYAVVRQRQAALGSQLLPSHPSMQQVRQELAIAEEQLKEELDRIEQTARLNLERASDNERRLESQLRHLKKISSDTNSRLVRLRELEREAEARRSVYSAFLLRSRELAEQQRVDSSMVTVISPAVPPRRHKGPPLPLISLAGLILGFGLGMGAALLRESLDGSLRSAVQLAAMADGWTVTSLPAAAGRIPTPGAEAELEPSVAKLVGQIRFDLGPNRGAAIVVMSPDADEEAGVARSAVAANLAVTAAATGDRVLLIDADGSAGVLSTSFGLLDRPGLTEVLAGEQALDEALVGGTSGAVSVLGLGNRERSGDLLDTNQVRRLLDAASGFDLIVIDGGVLMRDRSLRGLISLSSQSVVVTREGSSKVQLAAAFQALQKWSAAKGHTVIIAGHERRST